MLVKIVYVIKNEPTPIIFSKGSDTPDTGRRFDFQSNAYHLMLSAGNVIPNSANLPHIIFNQKQDFGITDKKVNLNERKVYSMHLEYYFIF